MTEPVARTSVHRTVRVAVALIAGQALLCGVVGWVTFGAGPARHSSAPVPTVEPLAGKPLTIPTPAPPPPRPPKSSASSSPSARESSVKAVPATTATRPRPTSKPAARIPLKQVSPPPPVPALPIPASADPVQSPVELFDVCAPAGALGRTADGVSVRCVLGIDGTLHWQIN